MSRKGVIAPSMAKFERESLGLQGTTDELFPRSNINQSIL
jgi:hypothetical protein